MKTFECRLLLRLLCSSPMKSFIDFKSEKLPYSNIPHTFKYRLINLAPIKVADKLNIAIPDIETPRTRRYKVYSSVYVTDTVQVFHLASKNVQPRINWCWFHYIVDGPFTFDPWWQSALLMDNSSGDNDIICVNNTLTLHLDNIKNYGRVIPLIAGSYSRLVLHGQCTWAQVKLLIKSNVKQVRIMNKIRVTPEEYDDVVKFIFSFCRDFDNKFSVHDECFPRILMTKLKEAFRHHETHLMTVPFVNYLNLTHFNHKRYWWTYYSIFIGSFIATICLIPVLDIFGPALLNLFPFLKRWKIEALFVWLGLFFTESVFILAMFRDQPTSDIAMHYPIVENDGVLL